MTNEQHGLARPRDPGGSGGDNGGGDVEETLLSHFADRSRFETYFQCPRKRFLNYHLDGKGVVPVGEKFDLTFGKAIHSHLERTLLQLPEIAFQMEPTGVYTPDNFDMAEESLALYNGLISTFTQYIYPQILRDYDVVGAEEEMTFLLGGTTWMSRLDGVLRRKSDGLYFVLEAKTSSWLDSLYKAKDNNFQLMMEVEAMRRHYNLSEDQVGGALLLVYNKGRKQRASKTEQEQGMDGYRKVSPFTYWFMKDYANGERKYGLEWKSGWDRVAAWTIPDYLEILGANWPEAVEAQVQLWDGVSYDPTRMESVLRQVEAVEENMACGDIHLDTYKNWPEQMAQVIDENWPQNFGNCNNDSGFGKECAYKACCFSPNIGGDPVASGFYEVRVPNHPTENEKGEK